MSRSLVKEHPWVEAPYTSVKEGVAILSSVSSLTHGRAPMSCLQQLDALEANVWTNNDVQWNNQQL